MAAEAELLRASEIAREQTALSWELRVAMSLASLRQHHGRTTAAHDLLSATYAKFRKGAMADLRAVCVLPDRFSDHPSLR